MPFPPVALVTGAGSGIGRAACVRLADLGYRLTLVGRTETRLQATMDLIAEQVAEPRELLLEPADVADAQQAAATVTMTLEQWGRLDAVVNNAGVVRQVPIEENTSDVLFEALSTNLIGPAAIVAAAWPAMTRQRGGTFVNVSSVAALDPFPGLSAYAASKSGLDSLTRSIHVEGAAAGIRAWSVNPGAVETLMLRGLFSTDDIAADQTLDPDEVASIIVECIRGERPEPSGSSIPVLLG